MGELFADAVDKAGEQGVITVEEAQGVETALDYVDGMAIDDRDNVYATASRGDKVGIYVFSPEGRHLAFIPTLGSPTNCAFGRGKESGTLYIAAGTKDADGRGKPYALYRIRLKVAGHHAVKFE